MATEEVVSQRSLVVITGLSGAGNTTALKALSDAGYYCVSNVPPTLAQSTVEQCQQAGIERIALGMDVRGGSFLQSLPAAIDGLREKPGDVTVLYLDAADDALVRRFSETRRPHPIIASEEEPLRILDGVRLERERLASIRSRADLVLDTTHMSVHELRKQLLLQLTGNNTAAPMMLRLLSFGFKYGVPLDANVMFDVRFIENPYFIPHLRELSGQDAEVSNFVLAAEGVSSLVDKIEELLVFTVPRYTEEGKSYLTVAIGCTGGRHRSVALSIELAKRMRNHTRGPIAIVHRDIGRGGMLTDVSVHRTLPPAPDNAKL